MAQTIQIPAPAAAKAIGLETWMQRVLDRADGVSETWGADDIHDLRVAIRRCRTIAEALSQVNPDPVWRKLKKSSRVLFRSLGDLRDTQMERIWLKKLSPGRDPLRTRLLRELLVREKRQHRLAQSALADFDHKAWKKWSRKVSPKALFFPLDSVVFQRLALARLNECAVLFERARKRPSAAAWHRARIGLKHFRYIAENFLPARYAAWEKDVKRLQDLLGEVHDLDVLNSDLRKITRIAGASSASEPWLETLAAERKLRLNEIVARVTGTGSVFPAWRSGFPLLRSLASPALPQRRTA